MFASIARASTFAESLPLSLSARTHRDAEIRRIVDESYDFVWRSLRRMGVSEADVDDATQEVFIIVARRFHDIVPSRERSFLFGTVMRVASTLRRTQARRKEQLDSEMGEHASTDESTDELLDQRRRRRLLDTVLDELELETRAAFVLYEIEGLTVPEIAELTDVPVGTAASRLRTARKQFAQAVKRLRLRAEFRGEGPA